jgi:hypothetical protein
MIAFARVIAGRVDHAEQQTQNEIAAVLAGAPDRSREVRAILPRFA